MAEEADVLIAWNHGGIPVNQVKSAFKRPTKFVNLPNPDSWAQSLAPYGGGVRAMIAKYAPGVTPLRVGLLGFSASCQGVAQVLSSSDGGRVDAVVAVDGIHVGYLDKVKHVLNPAGMKPWLDFAALAANNERLFLDSYSSVVPPYASTTETANWLWEKLTSNTEAYAADTPVPEINVPATSVHVGVPPATTPYSIDYPAPPWKAKRRRGGLIMVGCTDLDPQGYADHIYQGSRMLPVLLAAVLAERWNAMDPKAPGASCFIAGAPHPADFFTLGASCAKGVVLPADYMSTNEAAPLPSSGISTATPSPGLGSTESSGFPWGAVALAGVAAVVVGGIVVGAPKAASGLSLQQNPLAYTVTFTNGNKTALIKYGSADDPGRVFTLRVHKHATWELINPDGYRVSEGTVQYGQLGYARGTALEHTVDKAEKVFRQTGIWAYSSPNKERWGVNQP